MSNMRRVVVTGLGIVSSVGVGCNAVSEALKNGDSGIRFSQTYADLGFRSQVHGDIPIDIEQQTVYLSENTISSNCISER